jgi:hypothetical protein
MLFLHSTFKHYNNNIPRCLLTNTQLFRSVSLSLVYRSHFTSLLLLQTRVDFDIFPSLSMTKFALLATIIEMLLCIYC